MRRAYLLMHAAIVLWGFTGIFGKAIQMNEGMIVWYRMILSALSLLVFMKFRNIRLNIDKKSLLHFSVTGILVALHWLTFYGAIKASNVSITLACFSSITLFTALFEPLFFRTRHHPSELLLAAGVVGGIYLIFSFQELYAWGIVLSIVSAMLGSLFTIINRKIMERHDASVATFYELSTGFLFLTAALPIYFFLTGGEYQLPCRLDWLWLILLSVLCTTVAFTISMEALKKVSAFTMNLSVNLEPVYSIILAIALFDEGKELHAGFYAGTLIILSAVVLHTVLVFKGRK